MECETRATQHTFTVRTSGVWRPNVVQCKPIQRYRLLVHDEYGAICLIPLSHRVGCFLQQSVCNINFTNMRHAI